MLVPKVALKNWRTLFRCWFCGISRFYPCWAVLVRPHTKHPPEKCLLHTIIASVSKLVEFHEFIHRQQAAFTCNLLEYTCSIVAVYEKRFFGTIINVSSWIHSRLFFTGILILEEYTGWFNIGVSSCGQGQNMSVLRVQFWWIFRFVKKHSCILIEF